MKSLLFKLCLVAGCSMFMFADCNKSDDTPTSTESFTVLTAGSSWTYLGTPGGSYKLTVTNKDTVALGRTYKVLTNSAGANSYEAKVGGDYFRFGAFAGIAPNGLEELYLKDGQAVNATWSSSQPFTAPGFPVPLTANLGYSVKEKGVARTVSGKAFTNVIHIRLDISISGAGIGGGDFYYAQGIGLIEGTLAITVPGQTPINQTQVLTAYEIK